MNLLDQILTTRLPDGPTVGEILLSLLLALVVGQVIAYCYIHTHAGVSYSRSFAQSLILLCVVVCMVMSVVGNSIALAFGLGGALAMTRFRTPVRDTKDAAFLFLSVSAGMAMGAKFILIGIAGTLVFCAVAWYLRASNFGSRIKFGGMLQLRALPDDATRIGTVLRRFCTRHDLVSVVGAGVADGDSSVRYAFEIEVRDAQSAPSMIQALRDAGGIEDVNVSLREENEEI